MTLTPGDLAHLRSKYRRPWAFTNGVFDLLHPGHVAMLEQCRQYGTVIVGLNSDKSVRLLGKGEERPYVDETGRAMMLLALKSVDVVVTFKTLTAAPLIAQLKPDYYIKGPDYHNRVTEETLAVESYGGTVIVLDEDPLTAGYRTSKIVAKIRSSA